TGRGWSSGCGPASPTGSVPLVPGQETPGCHRGSMAYAQAPGGVAPRKLSKTGIVWAIVVFAVTAIIGIVMIVLGVMAIADTLDDFQQVDVPGSSTLQLDEGEQWIFVGGSGVDVFDVDVSVTDP